MSSTLVSVLVGANAFLGMLVVIAACDYLHRIRPMALFRLAEQQLVDVLRDVGEG
ncbi:hypothetical protein [Pseudomonas aeruginosa]|uniref:hypothetical protein n=1 Tax=Pseudomonas aeruginosa TaxID=287 RepID=UPI0018E0492E|nr:hypothetical protein [Pseudomonas aeruginosa]QPZ75072.1 hypothetical protein I9X29_16910 [Pseudomonas aeruginosa]